MMRLWWRASQSESAIWPRQLARRRCLDRFISILGANWWPRFICTSFIFITELSRNIFCLEPTKVGFFAREALNWNRWREDVVWYKVDVEGLPWGWATLRFFLFKVLKTFSSWEYLLFFIHCKKRILKSDVTKVESLIEKNKVQNYDWISDISNIEKLLILKTI